MRKLLLIIIASFLLFNIYLLVTSHQLLVVDIVENPRIPFGNVSTYLALITLPIFLRLIQKSLLKPKERVHKLVSLLMKIAIVFSIFWIVVGYALSGNFATEFSNTNNSQIFWMYSYFIVLFPIVLSLINQLYIFIRKQFIKKL